MTPSLHQVKISVEMEWICRRVGYENKSEDKCMSRHQRYDKVQRGHTRVTGRHYKTKCMNHEHRKREKV